MNIVRIIRVISIISSAEVSRLSLNYNTIVIFLLLRIYLIRPELNSPLIIIHSRISNSVYSVSSSS